MRRADALAAILVPLGTIVATSPWSAPAAADPGTGRQAEIVHLLRHDCGACHGIRLTGGLGPPLTPDALAGKPVAALRDTILHGRPGTPMPPWRNWLTPEEAAWLAAALKEGKLDGG